MENRVVLGLSGGVDSAVAARLLAGQGFAVTCCYLDNGVGSPQPAEQAARELGLPFLVRDIRSALAQHVCQPFGRAYRAGRTPNPCALCNPAVKFPALLRAADDLGARWVATGHYALARAGRLFKGQAPNDQSYLLSRLRREQLERCLFPLGEYKKSQVRELAGQFGLSAAERPGSMEICFIPDDDRPAWLARHGYAAPEGDFVDKNGAVLGRHRGIHCYTLGQGSGLGVSGPHKYYVCAILPEKNQVVLSDGDDLLAHEICLTDFTCCPEAPGALTARFRHSRTQTPVTLEPLPGGEALLRAPEGVRAPTPGQLAVLYDGDAVWGSGWIK